MNKIMTLECECGIEAFKSLAEWRREVLGLNLSNEKLQAEFHSEAKNCTCGGGYDVEEEQA